MIESSKNASEYMRALNSGTDALHGLLSSLPLQDQAILAELEKFQDATRKIEDIYGKIPKSPEESMHLLHDKTIAESLMMAAGSRKYAGKQRENVEMIRASAMNASPKGAIRITARANAEILHTLNQLLRINGQILKLQSEQFGLSNKDQKENVLNFQHSHHDLSRSMTAKMPSLKLPRF